LELEPLLIGRIVERLLIVLVGGMCVYLGYRLFDRAHQRQGELELKGQTSSLKLRDVAPGIYFALFGSLLLIVAVFIQLEIPKNGVNKEGVKYLRNFKSAKAKTIDLQLRACEISVEQAYKELKALVENDSN